MAILEVKNLEKHFGRTRVLEDISFTLERVMPFQLSVLPAAEKPLCCAA